MTRARWAILGGVAVVPLVVVVLLLVGIAVGDVRMAALVGLTLVLVVVGVVVGVGVVAVRRFRRVTTLQDGESIRLDRPSPLVVEASPVVANWPRAQRVSFGRALPIAADVVAGFGMATRSPFAREQLTGLATGWRLGWPDIAAVFETTSDPEAVSLALGRIDPTALVLLARTVASQSEGDAPFADAVARYLTRTPDADTLPLSARHWLLERLIVAGDLGEASRRLGRAATTTHSQLAAIDVLNPFIAGARQRDSGAWSAALNSVFRRAGLEGISMRDGADAPLDRIEGDAAEPVEGELVTVVMTVYRPAAAALRAAVASVLAQSWVNWELLLVDDGSPAEFDELLAEIAALDDRIRLIRGTSNAGTYVRRNEAIGEARGAYVTMHDSDDWMHPRRLEIQMRHLVPRPGLLANVCRSARVTPDLRFVQPRGTLLRLTESSLLFRRSETIERVGFFDSVRKAADTGYRQRIELAAGQPVPIVEVGAPLILSRYDETSLSGADLRDGWTSPERVAYSSAHAAWVASERASGRSARVDFPLAARPFPAPAALTGDSSDQLDLDLLFVLDVRDDRRRRRIHRRHDAEIRAAVELGLRVGIRRLDALSGRWISSVARRSLQNLVNAGVVADVLPLDRVHARLVLVIEEAALLGAPSPEGSLTADRVLIVADAGRARSSGVGWSTSEADAGAARLVPATRGERVSRSEAEQAVASLARNQSDVTAATPS